MLAVKLGSARVTQVVPVLTVGKGPREQLRLDTVHPGWSPWGEAIGEDGISGVVEAPGWKVSWRDVEFGTVWQDQSP